jgi:dihydroflavonol-4-reductase
MKCYVTGGNGFVGSHVVRALVRAGYEVTALVGRDLDLANLEGVEASVRDLDLLDERSVERALEGGEALFHTAACYSFWEPNRERIYRVNVDGTRTVLHAAMKLGDRKAVHTSSTATLVPSFGTSADDEDRIYDARHFHGHYKASKVMAEMAALRVAANGLPVVIVHPTTVLGAGDRRPTPTGGMIVHYLNGRMKAYTNTVLNLVDVEDVAAGHVLAFERGQRGHRYILGGENVSMREMTRMLQRITGIPAPTLAIPSAVLRLAGRVNEWIADHLTGRRPLIDRESTLHAAANRPFRSEKAQSEIGYAPSRAEVALRKSVRWFIAQGRVSPACRAILEAHALTASDAEARAPASSRECSLE